MSPPPIVKKRSESANNIYLKEGDWKVLKMQLLKLSKGIDNLRSQMVAMKKLADNPALKQLANSITPELLQKLNNLLTPRINHRMIRVTSKKYKTEEVFKDLSVYRNGQRVGDYVQTGPKEITFGDSITVGVDEVITCDYTVAL